MGAETLISWAKRTFNPWIGCDRVSPGCANCYAADYGNRFGVEWGQGKPRRLTSASNWAQPLAWNKAAKKAGKRERVFCASLADWADEEAPEGARVRLWALIRATPWLDWLLLTKRPENVRDMLPPDWGNGYDNVQLGFTAENQLQYDKRVAIMETIPAKRRFVSAEPLLGHIDLGFENWERRAAIHQVIVGGESGPSARPMAGEWARAIRDQCVLAGVAFHFKQWGEYAPGRIDIHGEGPDPLLEVFTLEVTPRNFARIPMVRLGKKNTGRLLDGREWNETPEPIGLAA
jgi:protein gp37